MYRDDGSGPSCQQGADGFGRNVLAVRIDIGEDWFCSAHYYTARRGDEGSARHDNFVAWANPQGVEREFQSNRAIGQGDAVLASCLRRKLFLEQPTFFPRPVINL